MRIAAALPCLLLLFLPAAAAPDATAAYLAARDRYIAQFNANPAASDFDKREQAALADLEQSLKAIIPSWHTPGFPAEGRINLDVLHQDLGFGNLDGLNYRTEKTEVIVTTPALVRSWIADYDRRNSAVPGFGDIPRSFDAAIRSEPFWGFGGVEISDERWLLFGEVPVKATGATALLALDTDSGFPDGGPKYLLVAVQRGDRVFVARQQLAMKVSRQPVCERLLRSDRGTDAQVARDFQTCYAPALHQQPQWHDIRDQAQALVDLLH